MQVPPPGGGARRRIHEHRPALLPGQGYHYIKNSLVGTTDIRHPSVLMYTADGRLNGPEWVAPVSDFPTPPSIFGQTMHSEDELGLWTLHVWVWKLNPDGVFNDTNPRVTPSLSRRAPSHDLEEIEPRLT